MSNAQMSKFGNVNKPETDKLLALISALLPGERVLRVLPRIIELVTIENSELFMNTRGLLHFGGIPPAIFLDGVRLLPYDPELAAAEIHEQERMYNLEPL